MEESKNDRMERIRLFLRNNGFYIALVVCLVVIGGAILLLALDKPESETRAEKEEGNDPIVIVGQSQDELLSELLNAPTALPAAPVKSPVPTAVPTPVPTPVVTPSPTAKTASTQTKVVDFPLIIQCTCCGNVIFSRGTDKIFNRLPRISRIF